MAVATLTRGSTSIDLPLVEESGEILVAATFGKPEVQVRDNGGTQNPRTQDQWSGIQNFELRGELFDYQTAHDLADLIKTASATPLELSLPSDVYADPITVAPAAGQDSALTLSWAAGQRDIVGVNLSLTRVDPTRVFAATEQSATTPTASGTGPVQVSAAGVTVDIPTAGLSLERTVGRPNDTVRRQPGRADPRYEVKAKVSTDVFTFAFETVSAIKTTLNALTENIFREQLGRTPVTVDFNGLLGLGAIEAIPVGSSPFRQTHQAGQSWVGVPTFEFRRAFDTSA